MNDFLSSLTTDEHGAYLITSAEYLKNLATYVNSGNNCYGLTFKLANDIDLKDVEFTAIGTQSNPFKGIFDGDGKIISNLTINSTEDYQGLFGYVGKGGTIKNITLENVKVTGSYYVGGVVGWSNFAVINCIISGKSRIEGTFKEIGGTANEVGGIVGYNNGGTIENCTVNGAEVTGEGDYVGGIVGSNYGTVENCTVSGVEIAGTCESSSFVGGVVGWNKGAVENCTVSGDSTISGEYCVGCIVGWNVGKVGRVFAESCTVSAGNDYVGAIVGHNYRDGTVTEGTVFYHNCYDDSEQTKPIENNGEGTELIYVLTAPEGYTFNQNTGTSAVVGNKLYYNAGEVSFKLTADNGIVSVNKIKIGETVYTAADGKFTVTFTGDSTINIEGT